jgi:hypothetical protein
MANLSTAAAKYERKTSQAAAHWEAATKQYGAQNYCKSMTEFLGGNAGRLCQSYQQGIASASAASYQQGVAGKGQKWMDGMRRAAGV